MYKFIKIIILFSLKYLGFFTIAARLTRGKLGILCYHGFAYDDQADFRSQLFIKKRTLQKRVDYLKDKKFHFIDIEGFNKYLDDSSPRSNSILLTIDDGWKSSHDIALPILSENDIPHIIYLYTDCFNREVPVLNVLLQYVLWKTKRSSIIWAGCSFDLTLDASREELLQQILQEISALDKSALNVKLLEIFRTFEVEYSKNREWKNFSLLNKTEVQDHLESGGTFQLHTHHHINPLQDDLLSEELRENQHIIEDVTGQKAEHFCYPSGVYSKDQFPLLEKLGIKSAVTCKPGLNDQSTHCYELKRFLDGENISQIEFEAEMSGFLDFARRLFRRSYH